MLKTFIILLCLYLTALVNLSGQNHDYNWIFGYDGNTLLDFNTTPPSVSIISANMNFRSNGGTCSDSTGNLLFYTNGIRIFNHNFQLMTNGDTINPGPVWNNNQEYGYTNILPIFAIPKPDAFNIYYLIHTGIEFDSGSGIVRYLYYSIIDMNANNGLGEVIMKNVVLMEGDIMCPAVVKHGNGRDWWIMGLQRAETNHYLFLLSPDGISDTIVQDIGPAFTDEEFAGISRFSQSGALFLRHDSNTALRLYDFDRCSGLLSNLRIIPFQEELHSWEAVFSPSDRFLYFNRPGTVWSLDLEASDLDASYDTLTVWELNFCPEYPWNSAYIFGQLAPDNKIYYAGGTNQCLNVTHRPDLPGDAADVEEAAVPLLTWNSLTLNHFPNYRLGEWDAAPCDTLNFQQPDVRFEHRPYNASRFDHINYTDRSYTILPALPGTACADCSERDLAYLNNPLQMAYALYIYKTTGKLPDDWPAEQAAREGMLLDLVAGKKE